jgi:hypothetical protein
VIIVAGIVWWELRSRRKPPPGTPPRSPADEKAAEEGLPEY